MSMLNKNGRFWSQPDILTSYDISRFRANPIDRACIYSAVRFIARRSNPSMSSPTKSQMIPSAISLSEK